MTTETVPVVRVTDATRSVEWYRRLGFEQVFEHRFEPHLPADVIRPIPVAGSPPDGASVGVVMTSPQRFPSPG